MKRLEQLIMSVAASPCYEMLVFPVMRFLYLPYYSHMSELSALRDCLWQDMGPDEYSPHGDATCFMHVSLLYNPI